MNRSIIVTMLITIASNIGFYFNFLLTFGQRKNILYSNKLWVKWYRQINE